VEGTAGTEKEAAALVLLGQLATGLPRLACGAFLRGPRCLWSIYQVVGMTTRSNLAVAVRSEHWTVPETSHSLLSTAESACQPPPSCSSSPQNVQTTNSTFPRTANVIQHVIHDARATAAEACLVMDKAQAAEISHSRCFVSSLLVWTVRQVRYRKQ
jgi:hypothetical protein